MFTAMKAQKKKQLVTVAPAAVGSLPAAGHTGLRTAHTGRRNRLG